MRSFINVLRDYLLYFTKQIKRKKHIVWPKQPMTLTPEEEIIKELLYIDVQQWGYRGLMGWFQKQGHIHIEKLSQINQLQKNFHSLDIGCGNGFHFNYIRDGLHFGLDFRYSLLSTARRSYQNSNFLQSDAYHLPFANESFDRVLSVYVFEHIHDLPKILVEVQRVLKPNGELLAALPAEGGIAYDIGRNITSKRYYEQKYHIDYMRLVRSEHCNTFTDVFAELNNKFIVKRVRYLPFYFPSIHFNAIIVGSFYKKLDLIEKVKDENITN